MRSKRISKSDEKWINNLMKNPKVSLLYKKERIALFLKMGIPKKNIETFLLGHL